MLCRGRFVLILATALSLCAAERKFEVRGQIQPPAGRATILIYAASNPFTARTNSDSDGRFRFRDLPAGAYTVSAFVPGIGEVEKTIEVGPGTADSNGRVSVTVSFTENVPLRDTLERQHKVDLAELGIPDTAKREYLEAQDLLSRNQVDQAILRLKRAVEIAPQLTAAWNNLGTISFHARQYKDAEGYFLKALEAEPGAYDPTVNVGAAIMLQGRLDEALKYNLYAASQHPTASLPNAQCGMNYLLIGDLDLALKYLKEAKRLDPNHFSFPQLYLARIYLERSDREAATAELEDFLARHPDAPQAAKVRSLLEGWRKQ